MKVRKAAVIPNDNQVTRAATLVSTTVNAVLLLPSTDCTMSLSVVYLCPACRDLKVPDLAGAYCMVVQFGSEGQVTLSSKPVRAPRLHSGRLFALSSWDCCGCFWRFGLSELLE